MKTKTLVIAVSSVLFSTAICAQTATTFGIRAGVNFQNLTGKDFNDDKLENDLKAGFHAGVNAEIPVGIDFYVQPGLLFSTKGAKSEISGPTNGSTLDVKTNISYLELPVNFVYKPELGQGRMILGFGPYAAYALGGKYEVGDLEEDLEFGDQPTEMKRFDAGANLLAGYEFANKLSVQLNAGLGLIRLNNRADDDKNSSVKNTGFGVSLGYRFGQ
jgi:hypothetical protein